MAIVKVSNTKNNRKMFISIAELAKDPFVNSKLNLKIMNNAIVYGKDTFMLDMTPVKEKVAQRVAPDGFKHFETLRHKGAQKSDYGKWLDFTNSLVSDFYKEYSYLTYSQTGGIRTAEEKIKQKTLIAQLLGRFIGNRYTNAIIEESPVPQRSDIYGAVVKLKLVLGSGIPVPFVNKFYFKAEGDRLIPLNALETQRTNQEVELIEKTSLSSKGRKSDYLLENLDLSIAHQITQGINNILLSDEGFAGYLNRDCEEWVQLYKYQAKRNSEGEEAVITCEDAKLRYIFRLVWENNVYNFKINGDNLFTCVFGLGGNIRVICSQCASQGKPYSVLIDNNRLIVKDEAISLDDIVAVSDDGTKLALADGRQIINPFFLHNFAPNCFVRNKKCEHRVCGDNMLQIRGKENKVQLFCKNCIHPEVIYPVSYNGETQYFYTRNSNLVYCTDVKSLLPIEHAKECKICKRRFSKDYFEHEDNCKFCQAIINVEERSADFARYRNIFLAHKDMFSPFTRLNKYNVANEDEEVILFKVKDEFYIVYKDKAFEGNYIKINKLHY